MKLSCFDVSICLGLSALGDDIVFDSELCGEVGLLFPFKEIKIKHIIERMREFVTEVNHVESSRTSRTVTNMPLRL